MTDFRECRTVVLSASIFVTRWLTKMMGTYTAIGPENDTAGNE